MTRRVYKTLLIIALIIFTLLAKEATFSPKLFLHFDKVAHFAVFFVLAFISHHAFNFKFWVHFLLLSLYGAGIEWMQLTLPNRVASTTDFIADIAGALSYFALYYLWDYLRRGRHA